MVKIESTVDTPLFQRPSPSLTPTSVGLSRMRPYRTWRAGRALVLPRETSMIQNKMCYGKRNAVSAARTTDTASAFLMRLS